MALRLLFIFADKSYSCLAGCRIRFGTLHAVCALPCCKIKRMIRTMTGKVRYSSLQLDVVDLKVIRNSSAGS